ncbi:hypothetical protein F4604DRAFT_1684381 [Suillus subluteus]|nr:hypothetical protein F4604DRAFT_1684381 [Suillus subluteus]
MNSEISGIRNPIFWLQLDRDSTQQLFSPVVTIGEYLQLSPLVPQTMVWCTGSTMLHSVGLRSQGMLLMRHIAGFELCKTQSKRASKKKVQSRADLDPNMPINPTALNVLDSWSLTPDIDESILTMGDDIACSCDIFTLQTIETLVRHWEKDWASEDLWNASYHEALTFAQAQGEQETMLQFYLELPSLKTSNLKSSELDSSRGHSPCLVLLNH